MSMSAQGIHARRFVRKPNRPLAGWTTAFPKQHAKLRPAKTLTVADAILRQRIVRQKPVRKRSKAMAKKMAQYAVQRVIFLSRNTLCQCCPVRRPTGIALWADDVHHKRGRGKFLMDKETWLPVCRPCHTFIHDNPQWAYENGMLERRDIAVTL